MAEAALGRLGPEGVKGDEQMDVEAPVAGEVLNVFRQSEGVVRSGQPLVEIGDPKALEIVVDVLTSDAVGIRRGAEVIIDRWGGDRPLNAHVRTVEPSAFTRVSALGVDEQRVNVIIDLDDPPEVGSELGDGYRVEARIVVQDVKDVVKVHDSAVFRHGEGWAVYRVYNGQAKLTPIEMGARNGLEVEVADGLDPGILVIAHPGEQVDFGHARLQGLDGVLVGRLGRGATRPVGVAGDPLLAGAIVGAIRRRAEPAGPERRLLEVDREGLAGRDPIGLASSIHQVQLPRFDQDFAGRR